MPVFLFLCSDSYRNETPACRYPGNTDDGRLKPVKSRSIPFTFYISLSYGKQREYRLKKNRWICNVTNTKMGYVL